jgi:glutamate N-acetyltransferase/amino-acid N-acetyltransferase
LAAVGRSNITHLKADEVNIYLGEVCIVSRGELAPVALSEQASLVEVSPSTVIRLND